jgi:hypothetical protein
VAHEQHFAAACQQLASLRQQRAGAFVDLQHSLEIENQVGKGIDALGNLPQYPFNRAEKKAALKLENTDRSAIAVEDRFLGQAAAALGAYGAASVDAPNDDADGRAALKHVNLEALGNLPAHVDTAHAVALIVEQGGVRADAKLTGQHGDDAAADTALGG